MFTSLKNSKFSITIADLKNDRDNILALWKRNFPNISEKRFSWMYENNPAGAASCLLLNNPKENSVIGATALFPRRIFINGKPILSAVGGDFMVDKEHRSLGPALSLQKAATTLCDDEIFNLIYVIPNKNSGPVVQRAKYKVLCDMVNLTKPLRSYYQLKKHFDIPVVTKMVSKPVDLAMRIISKENYYKKHDDHTFELPLSFDERFDELWKEVSSVLPVIGERSSSYLNWRFSSSPHKEHYIFSLVQKQSKNIQGYIVFHISESRVCIDDMLCLDMDETLDCLLSKFLSVQRKKGMDSVTTSYGGTPAFINKFQEHGFSIRGGEDKIMVYVPSGSPHLAQLMNAESWYLLPGDKDI